MMYITLIKHDCKDTCNITIYKKKKASNKHILMFEGLCDTTYSRNDLYKFSFALTGKCFQYINTETCVLKRNIISENYCFHCIFDQINVAPVNMRLFQKHLKKTLTGPKCWMVVHVHLIQKYDEGMSWTSFPS